MVDLPFVRSHDSPMPADEDITPRDGWPYFRREVMSTLERLEAQNTVQNESISKLDKDLAVLQTRMMLTSAALALFVSAMVELGVKLLAH